MVPQSSTIPPQVVLKSPPRLVGHLSSEVELSAFTLSVMRLMVWVSFRGPQSSAFPFANAGNNSTAASPPASITHAIPGTLSVLTLSVHARTCTCFTSLLIRFLVQPQYAAVAFKFGATNHPSFCSPSPCAAICRCFSKAPVFYTTSLYLLMSAWFFW